MPQTVTNLSCETAHEIAQSLQYVLSDTFMLYLKTHTYHWNVEGPQFFEFHKLFEEQYTDMWHAVDKIAERTRSIGERAPLSHNIVEMSTIPSKINPISSKDMLKDLALSQSHLLNTLKSALSYVQDAEDEATADLLIKRISAHEKQLWMLKSCF